MTKKQCTSVLEYIVFNGRQKNSGHIYHLLNNLSYVRFRYSAVVYFSLFVFIFFWLI